MRGVYLAAAGLLAEQTRAAAAGRLLNNLETPGFRGETTVLHASWGAFQRADSGVARGVLLGPGPGLVWAALGPRPEAGIIRNTGVPTDLALEGPGFFVLGGDGGEVLTRDGCFHLDGQGYLVGAGGRRVLGMEGPLRATGRDLTVTSRGEVYVDGARVGRLRLESPDPNPGPLLPGGVLPRPPEATPATDQTRVYQGGLEFAGHDPVGEVVALMTALRSYEAAQRAVQSQDEALQKLLESLGNL